MAKKGTGKMSVATAGARGGKKGGPKRAEVLTTPRKKEIARMGGLARQAQGKKAKKSK